MKKFIVRPSRQNPGGPKVTITVDDEDAHLLRTQPWAASIVSGCVVITQSQRCHSAAWNMRLGQIIMRSGEGEVVEHINHDALDFRRANLRIIDSSEYRRTSIKYARQIKQRGRAA